MDNENLNSMIDDFVKRHEWDATREEIILAMQNNLILVNEESFFVFNVYFNRFQMFFAYVKPGHDARKYWKFFEDWAKKQGCTKLQFATKRYKAFERYFPDYHKAGIIFEKDIGEE